MIYIQMKRKLDDCERKWRGFLDASPGYTWNHASWKLLSTLNRGRSGGSGRGRRVRGRPAPPLVAFPPVGILCECKTVSWS